jgi:DMSO/TMAO reductase YedYZ molybdopterin-dependent catalytic subunit
MLAGGLASASNVFVFQLFAALPADTLAYGAMLLIGAVAFASGMLFAGVLGYLLLNALRRSGVVKDHEPKPMDRRVYTAFLIAAVIVAAGLLLYLRGALRGSATVTIGGAVAAPYEFPLEHGDIQQITAEATLRDVSARYTGYPLAELIARAEPQPDADKLLLRASDGYAFFISMDELRTNDSLLLAPQGQGEDASYSIVGPESSKAWVRGVTELVVVGAATIPVDGRLAQPAPFDPADWASAMDSVTLDVGDGAEKYQGAPLGEVLASMQPQPGAEEVVLHSPDGEEITLSLAEVIGDDDTRLFTIIGEEDVTFAVARMNGEVLAPRVIRIEVQ